MYKNMHFLLTTLIYDNFSYKVWMINNVIIQEGEEGRLVNSWKRFISLCDTGLDKKINSLSKFELKMCCELKR